jgi:hypothetical protein
MTQTCPVCSKVILVDSVFCQHCGSPLSEDAVPPKLKSVDHILQLQKELLETKGTVKDLAESVDSLRTRIKSTNHSVDGVVRLVNEKIPNSNIFSHSLRKRVIAIFGHNLYGYLAILFIAGVIYGIVILITFLVYGSLPW